MIARRFVAIKLFNIWAEYECQVLVASGCICIQNQPTWAPEGFAILYLNKHLRAELDDDPPFRPLYPGQFLTIWAGTHQPKMAPGFDLPCLNPAWGKKMLSSLPKLLGKWMIKLPRVQQHWHAALHCLSDPEFEFGVKFPKLPDSSSYHPICFVKSSSPNSQIPRLTGYQYQIQKEGIEDI